MPFQAHNATRPQKAQVRVRVCGFSCRIVTLNRPQWSGVGFVGLTSTLHGKQRSGLGFARFDTRTTDLPADQVDYRKFGQ